MTRYTRNDVISSAQAYATAGSPQAQARFTDVLDSYAEYTKRSERWAYRIQGFGVAFVLALAIILTSLT